MYKWYTYYDSNEITLYVGQAGSKNTILPKGTLYRGAGQIQRNPFYSGDGKSIDTNFIVGTIIFYLESKGLICYWEHVCDDPEKENDIVKSLNSILQKKNARIKDKYKLRSEEKWELTKSKVEEAKENIINNFKDDLNDITI